MNTLELKVPPVAVFLIVKLLMYFADAYLPSLPLPSVAKWGAGGLFVMSGIVGLSGVYAFRQARTTVNPTKPERASRVVCSGIFRMSRNPMYLALLLLILAYAVWLQNGVTLLAAALFVLYMNRFQILPEERALERIFGQDYLTYKQKVRRWI